ncbi:DUF3883 domain-containing protein [Paenarthrobacter sp. UW852]|uniref:DUF3883 domain-containing protein n=1 Tax=Paenarthrobacter sp. UW852 TaxID=2951989 RepID=UPI0021487F88|nr:DUF3883 domain-containing protein [Paenarthrobacter sp. UW852]MCR1161653.1 DUF3883 domain-containing protein [Paenarthrobacter sp. UW852]
MVINIRLGGRTIADPNDPLGRQWYGYDPTVTPELLWENNRGDWALNANRISAERWATLHYRGSVILVAELNPANHETLVTSSGKRKTALAGRVVSTEHPMYQELVGHPVAGRGRNAIMYSVDPNSSSTASGFSANEGDNAGGVGQGLQMDPEVRKAIEDAAQDRLMAYYRERGWTVTDTRTNRPYDAEAVMGDQLLYLEAKGTQSVGGSVIITRNEVDHARNHAGQCRMGIWSGMRLRPDGTVDPDAGRFQELDFAPEDQDLVPRDFDWRLPR